MKMKTRKIVAVKFDDGTERQVDDNDLRRYLEARSFEEVCAAFPGLKAWDIRDKVKALAYVRCEETSETNSKNAKPPRNEFARKINAKEELLAFKEQYERDETKTHGWKAKACEKFLIDLKTLNRILDRLGDAEK